MRKTTILIPVLFLRPGAFPVPGAGQVSMPESVFGFKPGADMKLLTCDQTACFALISDPKHLDRIDRFREIARRLIHPEGLTDDEARVSAAEDKVLVHIDGGCHAPGVAGPQMTP